MQVLEIIDMSEEVANLFTVKVLAKKWLERGSVYRATEETELNRDGKTIFNQIFKFLREEQRQTVRLMSLKPDTRPSHQKDGQSPKSLSSGGNNGSKEKGSSRKFNNNCLVHPDCKHLTRQCKNCMSVDVVQRGQLVKDKNECKLCLSLTHAGIDECFLEAMLRECSVDGCDESHSSMMHGCHC